MASAMLLQLLTSGWLLAGVPEPSPRESSPSPAQFCSGDYADDFAGLSVRARQLEQQSSYTFCLRSVAVYECPFYGADGTLRKSRRRVAAHGTAFSYQRQGKDTLLLTNQHVADWPAVTDSERRADDVPVGCKRVSESLQIVDNEADAFEQDDITLTRVVSDAQLDVSVLKARSSLPVMPWKVGRSAGLKVRNVVDVRGFPLGIFKATNVGKVVSAFDRDDFKDWNHDDFVIDALLSPGNSGSPVFGISCKTGEFELLGIYHAGYSRGSALNVVVGIDQVRELMTTFRVTPRARVEGQAALSAKSRSELEAASAAGKEPFFFPLGSLVVSLRARDDGSLVYALMGPDFPFYTHPVLALEDLRSPDGVGMLGRVWLGSAAGLKPYGQADFDAETQGALARLHEALRRDSHAALDYRHAVRDAATTREAFERTSRLEKGLRKSISSRAELVQTLLELAERMAPRAKEPAVTLKEVWDATSRPELPERAPPFESGARVAPGVPAPPGGEPEAG